MLTKDISKNFQNMTKKLQIEIIQMHIKMYKHSHIIVGNHVHSDKNTQLHQYTTWISLINIA